MIRTMTHHGLRARFVAAVVAAVALVATVASCGFDAPTLRSYTPAEGVNFAVGEDTATGAVLKARNLLVVGDDTGTGWLSGSLIVTEGTDHLMSVAGTALLPDGSPADQLTVNEFTPIQITATTLVVLVNEAPITIEAPTMLPGGIVELTFTFAEAGDYTINVPVIPSDDPVYATARPSTEGDA